MSLKLRVGIWGLGIALWLGAIGCKGPSIIYLGNWTGDFILTQNKSGFTNKQMRIRGYLQIYNFNKKFKMQVANPIQTVNVTGNWELNKNQILLHVANTDVDQPAKDTMEAMGYAFIDDKELKKGFEQNMIFDINSAHNQLHGLLMTVGPLVGHFELNKNGPAREAGRG